MTLHVFNPEHDIALASNLPNFTAPRAARGLRSDLGYIPVLWAEDGDAVLVDDAAYAERQMEDLSKSLDVVLPNVRFVTKALLRNLKLSSISPWGWDKTLCCELCRNGVSAGLCLSQSELQKPEAFVPVVEAVQPSDGKNTTPSLHRRFPL